MQNTAEIWIVDKDKVLAETLGTMLVVNDLTNNFKVFKGLGSLKKAMNSTTKKPQAILIENSTKKNFWKFASDLENDTSLHSPNLYFMGEKFNNEDLDSFQSNHNVKRLFKKPLRLDELKWIIEEL